MIAKLLEKMRRAKGDDLPGNGDLPSVPEHVRTSASPVREVAVPDPFSLNGAVLEEVVPVEERRSAARRAVVRGSDSEQVQTKRKARSSKVARADYQVLGQPSEVLDTTHRKLLLCSHSVSARLALDDMPAPDGYIAQPRREPAPLLRALAGRKLGKVHVSIDARVLERGRVRYGLALDGYLRWGHRNADGCVAFFGGSQDASGSYLDVLVFRDRVLVEVLERNLPAADAPHFGSMLHTLIEEIDTRYAGARFVAGAPLVDWNVARIEYLGTKPLAGISFVPLSARQSAGPSTKGLIALGLAGLAVYGGMVGTGWYQYSSATASFSSESGDAAFEATGGINNSRLDRMQQRRLFMERDRPQVRLTKRTAAVVSGIASMPNVRIKSVRFMDTYAQTQPNEGGGAVQAESASEGHQQPKYIIEVTMPASPGAAVDQAKALMNALSPRVGLELSLTPGGWSTDDSAGVRTFTMEGAAQ